MSAQQARPKTKPVTAQPKKITLEDVRRKAEHVEDVARDDAKRLLQAQQTRVLIYAAVGVAVAFGVAYYLGSRAARRPSVVPEPTAE